MIDGWGRLYRFYPAKVPIKVKFFYPFRIAVRGDFGVFLSLYFPVMKIGSDKDNLNIGMALPLLFDREWAAVPWDDINVTKRIASPGNEFTFKGVTGVSLMMTTRLIRNLERASGKYREVL
jgi:hypothetical protein